MIHAIVIDDESVARATLYKYCKKYAPNFKVIENFDNGADAISYLKSNDVDLVFVDIKMPGISGIEVTKWIYENKPYIKVVVVSGYSDFEYAKQAMEYGAVYYLLKVIDIDAFKSLVSKITREYNQRFYNYKTVELTEFFYDVIYGAFDSNIQMRQKFREVCHLSESDTICRLIDINFEELDSFLHDKWHYSRDRFHNAIVNIIQKTYLQCFAMLIGENKSMCRYLLLFPGADAEQVKDSVIIEKIYEIMNMECTIDSEEMTVAELYEKYNDSHVDPERSDHGKRAADKKANHLLIDQVKEYIAENYAKGILKNDVAAHFNMNKDYLGRQFKEKTGKSITEYMLEIRISKAKQLIEENCSFSEICHRVGYIDTRNFRRLFQKATGMTMQEYKDRL